MLRSILSGSRAIFTGVVFFVLVVAGTQLYSWHFHRQSEAELRWTQQQLENNKVRTAAMEKPPPPGETTQSGHWHGNEWHSEPHTLSQSPDVGQVSVITDTHIQQQLQEDTGVDSDVLETEDDTDIPWEETAEAERLTKKLLSDWEDFAYSLQSKYPVLFDQQAINRVAQTASGRRQIKSQVKAMIDEALDEFERLFSQLPSDFSHKVLDLVGPRFTEGNTGIPQQYLDEALDMMRSRIN